MNTGNYGFLGSFSYPPLNPIKGTSSAITQSSSTATVSVPAGGATGDYIIVILRCRADRSFSIPVGWATHISTIVSNTRAYLVSKPFSSESSVSFTQSESAAYGMTLLLSSAPVITQGYNNGTSVTISKSKPYSALIGVSMNSGGTSIVDSPANYSLITESYFLTAPNYFYVSRIHGRTGFFTGSTSFTHNLTGDQAGSILVELG